MSLKKLLIIMLMLIPILSYGKEEPIFGEFSIKPSYLTREYQKYIGRTFKYLPENPESSTERNFFKFQGVAGNDYILVDVKPATGILEKDTKMTFTFQEIGNNDRKYKVKSWYFMNYYLPFLDIEKFNTQRQAIVGKTYSNPNVKVPYTIKELTLKEKNNRLVPTYIFNDGREFQSLQGIEKIIFEYALEGSYNSTLVKVETSEKSSEIFGKIKTIQDKGVTKFSFEDELINIIIFGDSSNFNFKLTNKSQNSIKIIWEDGVFVDFLGSTSKIMHSGVKYSKKEESQLASTIIRGASLDDLICPTANVRYSEILKEWVTDSMYPDTISSDVKQVQLMLPILTKGVIKEYVFSFDISYNYKHPELLNIGKIQ